MTTNSCGCSINWRLSSGCANCSLLSCLSVLRDWFCFLNMQVICCRIDSLMSLLRVVSLSVCLELTKIDPFTLRDYSISASWCYNESSWTSCSRRRSCINGISRHTVLASSTSQTSIVVCIGRCSLRCSWLLPCRSDPLSTMSRNALLL